MPKEREFGELFTMVEGTKSDAPLHDPILATGDHAAATAIGRAQALKAGLSPRQVAALYGTISADADDFGRDQE